MAGFVFRSKLVICCFGVLLLFLPLGGATAGTDTDWSIFLRASTPGYTNAGTQLRIGTQWNASDGYDLWIDVPYTAASSNQANVAAYMPVGPSSLYSTNLMSPLTGPGIRQWQIRVWAGSDYTNDTIRLAWWSTSAYTPPKSLNGYPVAYFLTVYSDPTGTYMPGTKWYLSPGSTGTSTSPVGVFDFLYDPMVMAGGKYIELRAVAMIDPEPSSILVLASGVAGMGGVIWRRRGNRRMERGSSRLEVLVIVFLLVLVAGSASGSETDWRIYMRASTVGYTNYNSTAYVGTQSNATNEYDSGGIDAPYTATTGNQASVVSYEPTYPHYPPFYTKNLKAPILHHVPSWDLIIWTTSGWSTDTALNTVRLSIWSNSTYTLPSTVGGAPMLPYSFRIVWDPTGTYQPGTRWDFTPGATGTSTEPVFYIDFNNGHLIRSADATAMDQGIRIHLEPVPAEPTSLLALASGLAGLGGVIWRRRIKP